jgi:hypothetical protein
MKSLVNAPLFFAAILCVAPVFAQREDPDPDDQAFPLAGLAPEGWQADEAQTIWYE